MTTIHITGGDNEPVDQSPLSAVERQALDAASADTFQPVFPDQPGERAAVFTPGSEYVSPVIKNQQRQQMLLPSIQILNDLDQRIASVVRFAGAPEQVATAAQSARDAVSAAREAYRAAQRDDNPRYTVSQAAKDAVVQENAKATAAVAALERAAEESKDDWFDGLVSNLDKQRADALKALRTAAKAYASLRGSINAAQALAVASGRWDKEWHSSTTSEADLYAPIASMRAAIGFLEDGDDYTTGAFLTAEYEEGTIPPHTVAKLKRAADLSSGGSFIEQLYFRARSVLANDTAAQDAVAQKRLILLLNSNPTTLDLLGKQQHENEL